MRVARREQNRRVVRAVSGNPVLDEDYLILSTIHSAKRPEWDSVYVLHAADGNIPADLATQSPAEIEAERRLLYVALTRAKSNLYVMHPQRYYFHAHHKSDMDSYSQRTRFIPDELLPKFDLVTTAKLKPDGTSHSGQSEVKTTDVRRKIGKM